MCQMIKVSRIAPEALHAVRVVLKYKMKDLSFFKKGPRQRCTKLCADILATPLSALLKTGEGGGESSQVKGGVGRGLEARKCS